MAKDIYKNVNNKRGVLFFQLRKDAIFNFIMLFANAVTNIRNHYTTIAPRRQIFELASKHCYHRYKKKKKDYGRTVSQNKNKQIDE